MRQPSSDWLCSLLSRSHPSTIPLLRCSINLSGTKLLTFHLLLNHISVPPFTARAINTRYAGPIGYLLVNDLWLYVNVSLKHKRLLSGTARSRGMPRLVCKVWREAIYAHCHCPVTAGITAPWIVTFPVPSQNQAGLPSRGKWRRQPPPPSPTSNHATFCRNTPVPSHSYVLSMHCFAFMTYFTKCCKKWQNNLFII